MTHKQPTTKARRRRLGRALALVTTTALAVTIGAAPAMAATPSDAADFLVDNLVGGEYIESTSAWGTSVDRGLTIDTFFALKAAGYTEAGDVADWLFGEGEAYYGSGPCDPEEPEGKELYSAPLAKYSAFLLAAGESANSQLSELKCLQDENGRFRDQSDYGDYSGLFGQSWGILALEVGEGTSGALTSAYTYLESRQCDSNTMPYSAQNGAFSSDLDNDPTTCTASEVDVDATALAAQALLSVGETTEAGLALTWLNGKLATDSPHAGLAWFSTACDGVTPEASVNSTAMGTMAYYQVNNAMTYDPAGPDAWMNDVNTASDGLPGCYDADPDIQNSNNVRATAQAVVPLYEEYYYNLML